MTATTRAAFISLWVLAVGLAAVYLEIENVHSGVRIRELMIERDHRLERFRRLEMRFNRMVSPDLLEKRLPDEFREPLPAAKKGNEPARPRTLAKTAVQ